MKTIALAAILFAFTAQAAQAAICWPCWDRVARCESGGNWSINTGNSYYGGLQFLASTWRANGGGRFASMPHYASRVQQITVASRMSLSNWPVCGRRYWG